MTEETTPRPYPAFIIAGPDGPKMFEPTEPRNSLIEAVIDCGMIDKSVKLFYLTEVPEDIRDQALAVWVQRIQVELDNQAKAEQALAEFNAEAEKENQSIPPEPTTEQDDNPPTQEPE